MRKALLVIRAGLVASEWFLKGGRRMMCGWTRLQLPDTSKRVAVLCFFFFLFFVFFRCKFGIFYFLIFLLLQRIIMHWLGVQKQPQLRWRAVSHASGAGLWRTGGQAATSQMPEAMTQRHVSLFCVCSPLQHVPSKSHWNQDSSRQAMNGFSQLLEPVG